MAKDTIHVAGLNAEDYNEIQRGALDWLKRNNPDGKKSDAYRAWLLEGAKRESAK